MTNCTTNFTRDGGVVGAASHHRNRRGCGEGPVRGGPFVVRDNRVFELGHSVARYVRLFPRNAHSAHSFHSAWLRSLALFRGSPTHFTHSLIEQLKFLSNTCPDIIVPKPNDCQIIMGIFSNMQIFPPVRA